MGSVSPKADEKPVSIEDSPIPVEDEEDMTSVMSSEQRKALQQAAKTEKESATLERETAKPPPSDARPVAIPRAAAVPAEVRSEAKAPVEAPGKAQSPVQAPAGDAEAKSGWAAWEIVAFVLLAAAVFTALRT